MMLGLGDGDPQPAAATARMQTLRAESLGTLLLAGANTRVLANHPTRKVDAVRVEEGAQ